MTPNYQFPYLLVQKVRAACTGKKDWDTVNELIAELVALDRLHHNLHNICAGLTDQNTRLTHENEFMLRLIEKHGIGENTHV